MCNPILVTIFSVNCLPLVSFITQKFKGKSNTFTRGLF